jgi:very-short-patch-repair endonuclease
MFPGVSMGDFSRFDKWRSSEENKRNLKIANKLVYSNLETREKRKRNLDAVMKTDAYKNSLSTSMKKYAQSEAGKRHHSNRPVTARMKMSNFQRWIEDLGMDEAIRRQMDWQTKNILPSASRDTKPELQLADLLRVSGFKFVKQMSLPRVYCDFYLPEYNLIIEVDGDYWHANPDRFSPDDIIGPKKTSARQIWANDLQREERIKSHGFRVMRIWASSLKTKTAQQLVEDIVRHCEKSQ